MRPSPPESEPTSIELGLEISRARSQGGRRSNERPRLPPPLYPSPTGDYLVVCPVRVVTFVMLGYRHTMIWFREYPCVLTISLMFFDHIRLHTWNWGRGSCKERSETDSLSCSAPGDPGPTIGRSSRYS